VFWNEEESFHLDSIWRKGVPSRFRRKMWPFIVQNKLELTKNLYRLILEEGRNTVEKLRALKSEAVANNQEKRNFRRRNISTDVIERIQADVKQTMVALSHNSEALREGQVFNVLIAFMMYRPDIGYHHNMSYLAAMFLLYCKETDAFIAFVNFIHSHYFLCLFKGQHSDVRHQNE